MVMAKFNVQLAWYKSQKPRKIKSSPQGRKYTKPEPLYCAITPYALQEINYQPSS